MYIDKISKTFTGYVRFRAEGYYIERFINHCRCNGFIFQDLKRINGTLIEASVSIKEYKEVCKIAKKNRCIIKIYQKKGIPFFIKKYRKRKIFFITLLFLSSTIFVLSKFIWNIEIKGTSSISQDEILSIVNEEGLKIGKTKSSINEETIVNKIRSKRSDVSWVGIKIVGTNAIIEIVEADKVPEVIDENMHCDIVASKDGVIEHVSAQNGIPKVKKGDEVSKGDILISGTIEGKYTESRFVHSNGNVLAKVYYSEKEKVYYKQKVEKRTGNTEKKYAIVINNFVINLYKKLSKFEIYDTISAEKKMKISSQIYLPIKLIKKENYEKIKEEINYSKEEAKNIGVDELTKKLDQNIQNKESIINRYINTNESEEYIEVEVIYEVLEDIGTEEKIAL